MSLADRGQRAEPLKFNTQVTDRGLETLSSMPLLSHLEVADTEVSDEGIKHLMEMKSLRVVDLRNTQVGAVSNFRAADDRTYRFDVEPSDDGMISIDVAEGATQDTVGNDSRSVSFNIRSDRTAASLISFTHSCK